MSIGNGASPERIKTIVALVREGGFAVFAVMLLCICFYQQRSNSELQQDTVRVIEGNTQAIVSLRTEIRELRLMRN